MGRTGRRRPRVSFSLGDEILFARLLDDAGIRGATITTPSGTAHFPSVESWIFADVRGWTLAESIDDRQFSLLLEKARQFLAQFVDETGRVSFPAPAHLACWQKPT